MGHIVFFVGFIYFCVFVWQVFLGYGTAYRLTKESGDNGSSLFGWLLLTTLSAIIPGLGFYVWNKYKNIDVPADEFAIKAGVDGAAKPAVARPGFFSFGGGRKRKNAQQAPKTIICPKCGREFDAIFKVCSGCGNRDFGKPS